MITAFQLRAARALLGIDQLTLALRSKLSLPTIQRMELIGEGGASTVGGRGVRLREREKRTTNQDQRVTIREQKLGARQPAAK